MDKKLIVDIVIVLSALGVSISVFFLLKQLFAKLFARAPNLQIQINKNLKKRLSYGPKQKELAKLGIMYRLNDYDLTPGRYAIIKSIASAVLVLLDILLFGTNPLYIVIAAILGYFLLDFYYKHENKSDNDEIERDINRVYIVLNVSLNSNIYIVDALVQAAEVARCDRLKKELMILSQNLSQKSILAEEAIQTFSNHFNSSTIRSFCNLLRAYFLYGDTDSYSKDLVNSVANSAKAQAIKDQNDMENKGQALTMAFFVIIIFAVVYIIISSISSMGSIF